MPTPPQQVLDAIAAFDARSDTFTSHAVETAVQAAAKNRDAIPPETRRGMWAECAAFAFQAREAPNGGPWGTHFQPLMSGNKNDGSPFYVPDLREADAESLAYWAKRAKAAKHPVLVARYADLVWDTTKFVTKGKAGIEFARLAIDNYVAASRLDDGSSWGDTRQNLGRALELAISVNDVIRTRAAVAALIEYVDRTSNDDHIGTYCYLFDYLLPPEKGPELTDEQERDIIKMFETKFVAMTTPGGQWDADPHSPRDVGLRLAAYYQRKGKPEERKRVMHAIAEAFERRAKIGDAMSALFFLQEARGYFLEAGLRKEADRVQREGQKVGPAAEKQLVPMTTEHPVPNEVVEKFFAWLMEQGLEVGLLRLTRNSIPNQQELTKQAAGIAAEFPLASIMVDSTQVLGHGHIQADLGDEADDPDGKMVHQTSEHLNQFDRWWLRWGLDHMTNIGLSVDQVMEFIRPCPLFTEDRLPLIRQGVEAHFTGDFPKAIHLLIPQIERALVNLLPLAGKPSNKAHRTGRGVMQAKNLNDVLAKEEWPLPGESGESLRMYLLSALAHPKGLNIRNFVCHGLWSADHFTKPVSERVLHVLLSVSLIRPSNGAGTGASAPASAPPRTTEAKESTPQATGKYMAEPKKSAKKKPRRKKS